VHVAISAIPVHESIWPCVVHASPDGVQTAPASQSKAPQVTADDCTQLAHASTDTTNHEIRIDRQYAEPACY
jgi:hypothetical protein